MHLPYPETPREGVPVAPLTDVVKPHGHTGAEAGHLTPPGQWMASQVTSSLNSPSPPSPLLPQPLGQVWGRSTSYSDPIAFFPSTLFSLWLLGP